MWIIDKRKALLEKGQTSHAAICEKTAHKLMHTGDGEKAKSCPYYANKWGLEEERDEIS